MEQTQIGFFQRLFYSITSFSFYKRVIKESSGKAILYLLLLSILLSLFNIIHPMVGFLNGVDVLSKTFERNIPDFEFINGELNVAGDMPIIIGKESDQVVIIDTSGQLDAHALDDYKSGVFISKNYAVNKDNAIKTETIDFTELGPLKFTKQQIAGFLPYLKYFTILIILAIFAGTIIGKLISSLVVSVIGLIINASVKSTLLYGEIYRAGVYAMTLSSICKLLLRLLSIQIPFFFIIYYAVISLYLIKAFSLIKEDKSNSQMTHYPTNGPN